MSILALDGFDHYATAHLEEKAVDDTSGWIDLGGRCDSYAYFNNTVGSGIRYGVTNSDEWGQVGVAYTPGSAYPNSSTNIVQIGNPDGTVLCFLSVETDGAVRIWSGVNQVLGTAEGTSGAGVAVLNDFVYFELRFRIHASAGELRLYVNGTNTLDATGLNLGSTPFGTVLFILNSSSGGCVDDIYIMNGEGASPSNTAVALGDVHVATILPESDASKGWTPSSGTRHSDLVDDPEPDDDATYVSSSTPGQIDSYNYPDLYRTSQTVYAVQTNIHARKDGIKNRTIKDIVNGSAGEEKAVAAENYVFHRQAHTLNPATGEPWTLSAVNNSIFGVELES